MPALLKPNRYLPLTALVLLAYSLALIMLPASVMGLLGIAYTPAGEQLVQFLGASLGGHALVNWRAKDFDGRPLEAVLFMNITALAIAVAIGGIAMLKGSLNNRGMAILIMHLLFLGGFLAVRPHTRR